MRAKVIDFAHALDVNRAPVREVVDRAFNEAAKWFLGLSV